MIRGAGMSRSLSSSSSSRPTSSKRLLGYAIAVVAVAAVVGIKLAIVPLLEQETPFLLFIAAVLVASWFGGFAPGVLATVLSAAASAFFFMRPYWNVRVEDPFFGVNVALFAGESLFIVGLTTFLRRAQHRAELANAEARRLEQSILETSERERRQFGHDLHDGLGQHLAGAAFRASLLSRKLSEEGSGSDSDDARAIESLITRAVTWTRELAEGLSPVRPRADGLAAALQELAGKTEKAAKVPCRFEGESVLSGRAVDPESAVQLYHVAREAVDNAVRQHRATRVTIALSAEHNGEDSLTLSVSDDGAQRDGAGQQTTTMAYRARLIGAKLDVKRLTPTGTSVTCTCPLRPRATATNQPRA